MNFLRDVLEGFVGGLAMFIAGVIFVTPVSIVTYMAAERESWQLGLLSLFLLGLTLGVGNAILNRMVDR